MSKLGGFFARKSGLYDRAAEQGTAESAPPDNPLELDEELFSTLGAQIGSDNETLRNLLLDAHAKIGELDTIKAAVDRLVDPIGKTLSAFEAEKTERVGLQTVLNNTRTAYGKLRNELAEAEKKAAAAEKDCRELNQNLAATQTQLRAAEQSKQEIAGDLAARRAQIVDLETRLVQGTSENGILRDECRRLDERLSAADKRIIALESELNATRQRLAMAEDEKRAQQASLDKASADSARLARKLAETETTFTAAQGRLRHVEANFATLSSEQSRLANAYDEAKERHDHELTSQRMRNEALTARAAASEKLLGEAREHLLARAEEIREFDRRLGDVASERSALQSRVSELESERIRRESETEELSRAQAALIERSGALARAFSIKEMALARSEQTIAELSAQIARLETAIADDRATAEQTVNDLNAALRREKMERSVIEGALETGRKDFSRLMREVMALQRNQPVDDETPPRAANAA